MILLGHRSELEREVFHLKSALQVLFARTGYNDYQRMVKDFKEFAGTTPTILIKESLDSPSRAFSSSSEFRGV
jgi:hypothetical protein